MKMVLQIPHPTLKSARKLKPLEMNSYRCDRKHSIISGGRSNASESEESGK